MGLLRDKIGDLLNKMIWRPLVRFTYNCEHANGWYEIKTFWIWQKIFRLNGDVPWMVHPSSRVTSWQKIKRNVSCDIGASPGCYIQAGNGIEIGENSLIAPNVGIISANHSVKEKGTWQADSPIIIGDNVWIGMNGVILPGVKIGNNVVIGAGSVVTKDIPSNCVAAGNPCRVISMQSGEKSQNDIDIKKTTI